MISKNGFEIIKKLEGYSALEYNSVSGKRTIGYGHRLNPDERYICGLSEKKAEEILRRDLDLFETSLEASVKVPLREWQRDALLSFIFDIGVYAFQRSTVLKELNDGNYNEVPSQMLRWVYVDGRFCSGLMRRRQTEAALFENKKSAVL